MPCCRFLLPAFASLPPSEGSSSAAALPPSSDPVSVTRWGRVQGCRGAEVQRCRVQRCRVQRCRAQRCRGAGEQGCRGAEVHCYPRTFCGALFFPTIATFLGSTLFEEVGALHPSHLTSHPSPIAPHPSPPGGVPPEARGHGRLLLRGRQGGAQDLPQAEPAHQAVQEAHPRLQPLGPWPGAFRA